jgi:hypothetical protein
MVESVGNIGSELSIGSLGLLLNNIYIFNLGQGFKPKQLSSCCRSPQRFKYLTRLRRSTRQLAPATCHAESYLLAPAVPCSRGPAPSLHPTRIGRWLYLSAVWLKAESSSDTHEVWCALQLKRSSTPGVGHASNRFWRARLQRLTCSVLDQLLLIY